MGPHFFDLNSCRALPQSRSFFSQRFAMAQALDTTSKFHGSEQGPSEGRHQEIRRPPNEDLPPLNLKLRKSQRQPVFCSLPAKIEEEKPRQKIQAAHSHPQIPNIRGGNHRETVLEPPGKKRQVDFDAVEGSSSSQTEVSGTGVVQDPPIEFSSQSSSEAVGRQDSTYGSSSQDDLYQSHHEHDEAFGASSVLIVHPDMEQCLNSDTHQEVNVRYNREDQSAHQEHALEDRCFGFKLWDFHIYAVFDGHDGSRASEFAKKQLAHFLIRRLRKTGMTDKEIQSALKFAIEEVDREFFSQLNDLIVERLSLQDDLEVC